MCASYLEDELRDIEMRDHEANEEATENKQLADLLEWKHDFTEFVEATVSDGCGVWVSLFGETDSAAGSQQRAARRDPREDATPCPRLLSETTLLHHVHPAQRRIQCDVRVHGARRREDGRCVRRNSTVSLRASPLSTVGFSDALIHVFDMTTPPNRSEAVRHKRRRFEESDACGAHSNGKLDLEMRSSEALDSDLDATSKAGPFPTVRFRGHTKSVTSVSWFEEDGIFLSGSIDGTIRLWSENLKTNICVFKYRPPFLSTVRNRGFRGHLYPVLDVAACPVGYYFLSASMDHSARLWCTETMEPIRICAGMPSQSDRRVRMGGCVQITLRAWTSSAGILAAVTLAQPRRTGSFACGTWPHPNTCVSSNSRRR